MYFPIQAFSLKGNNGKIELFINEVFGFPNTTSFQGGYDMKGRLVIEAGIYKIEYDNYYFSTGCLYRFQEELETCYVTLSGSVKFLGNYDRDLEFTVTVGGGVSIEGYFRANSIERNELRFEIYTDQTFLPPVIKDINNLKELFGGYGGIASR